MKKTPVSADATTLQKFIYHGHQNEKVPKSVKEATIHESVNRIGPGSFHCCTKLKKVTFNNNATKQIPLRAFHSCLSLTILKLPQNLNYIGMGAFQECLRLEAIFLPSSVTTIDHNAFMHCNMLRFFHVPDCVRQLGRKITYGCDHLFRNSNQNYTENDRGEITNDDEVSDWLIHRHDHCPLHLVCYSTAITVGAIGDCLAEHGAECAMMTNSQGMLPLHIVVANPYASSPDIISACYVAAPEAIMSQDEYGCTPLHYLCKYKASMIGSLPWLNVGIDFDSVSDEGGMTPLGVLRSCNCKSIRFMPLYAAIKHHISWEDGMKDIVADKMQDEGHFMRLLTEKDSVTGLYPFMLAAACDLNESVTGAHSGMIDLSVVYALLRANVDASIPCIRPQAISLLDNGALTEEESTLRKRKRDDICI